MARLDFESTMSMLDSVVRKKGQFLYIARRCSSPCSGSASMNSSTAAPNPNQPGSIRRHCAQENTHGIARRSSIAWVFLREAGREPMLRVALSEMTVEDQKYFTKPSVSYTSPR